ncbi:sigma-70 family RNA polymerase sigma factor [Pollutimonas sp. M17]|uniref:sigma-70 family RNA polymerase sigma factor n=1 Tax=Pollutimonas sp. M17 TaxID=2962065 RepID=UPI0021F3FC7A|nr:sigma-70 family RNA polymerase sigma factor [Pollutimonas sp. M17]UYO95437.1 sigma-70 family RNA polymerase sigma factor [Pollutimonas sp. M17]
MSFESEVVALLPVLRRYAHALTGNAAWADDLMQDTAERALNRRLKWRAGSNLKAWLLTMLRHLYIDQLRKQHDAGGHGSGMQWRDGEAPREQVDGLLLRDVQRALYRLPIDQREVLLLVGLEELSYQEAAAVLGIPRGTVMSRLSRARERMHSLMSEDGAGEPKQPVLKVVRSPR